jgi:hypothetical protein
MRESTLFRIAALFSTYYLSIRLRAPWISHSSRGICVPQKYFFNLEINSTPLFALRLLLRSLSLSSNFDLAATVVVGEDERQIPPLGMQWVT